jgi:23S rRNA (uracil1939-C5)-methyltransferase
MAANGLHEVLIESLAAGGAGVARINGKTVFVRGALPGERVLCRIASERRAWALAEALEITAPSAERVAPVCALFGVCGGCNLQSLGYGAQLAAKAAILRDVFIRIGGFVPPEPVVFSGAPWGYRNRMRLRCLPPPSAGFALTAAKNDAPVALADCPVADAGIRLLLGERAAGARRSGLERVTVYAREGLLLIEGERERGRTVLAGRELALEAGLFFQSNGAMLEGLIARLGEFALRADRGRAMADVYAGVGVFAAFLGGLFPRVDVVEQNGRALALARENLHGTAAEFFALDADVWAQDAAGGAGYGFMVVDPPRQGLSPLLARALAGDGPPLLAYVSCNPATLARDGRILRAGGYGLTALDFHDFYPHTAHIECLAIFERGV